MCFAAILNYADPSVFPASLAIIDEVAFGFLEFVALYILATDCQVNLFSADHLTFLQRLNISKFWFRRKD